MALVLHTEHNKMGLMIMEPGITIISDSPIGGRTEEQKADRQAKVQESQDRHQEELDAQ